MVESAAKKTAAKAEPAPAPELKNLERNKRIAAGQCVVDEPFHVGRAVNGLVCSYHAMHYLADGTPRAQ